MLYQKERGFYLYRYSLEKEKPVCYLRFKSIEDFYQSSAWGGMFFPGAPEISFYNYTSQYNDLPSKSGKVLLATESGYILEVSKLIHGFRAWYPLWERNRNRSFRFQQRRRQAYGKMCRHVRTTAEIRENAGFKREIEGYSIRIKGRTRNLPSVWDDVHGHNDKSWKTQSKRRKQYRD